MGREAQGPEEGRERHRALALVPPVHPLRAVAAGRAAVARDQDLPQARVADGLPLPPPGLEGL
jgi:hypothetical protein